MRLPIRECIIISTILCVTPSFAQDVSKVRQLQKLYSGDVPGATQYRDIKYCGTDNQWLSYEVVMHDGSQELYLLNVRTGVRNEVTPEQPHEVVRRPATTALPDTAARHAPPRRYSGELVWNPRRVDGSAMYAFVGRRGGNTDVYVALVNAPLELYRMTADEQDDDQPVWSPDGRDLVFTSRRNGGADVYRIVDVAEVMEKMRYGGRGVIGEQVDRGRHLERITLSEREEVHPTFTPDGQTIVYTVFGKQELGDRWSSRISARHRETEREVVLVENRVSVVDNASFSPDGNTLAHYSSAPGNLEGKSVTSNIVLREVQYNERKEIVGANVLWPEGTVRSFDDVKPRAHAGPYWSKEGALLFLREGTGNGNTILLLPSDALSRNLNPRIGEVLCLEDGGAEMNVGDFDFLDGSVTGQMCLTSQSAQSYGVYWVTRQFNEEPAPASSSQSILLGFAAANFLYVGDADMKESWGGEAQAIIPLSGNLSLIGNAGRGSIKAKIDINNETVYSRNAVSYATLQLGYRFTDDNSFALLGAAGIGLGNFANDIPNTSADGVKLLIPVGIYGSIPLSESISMNTGVSFTFTNLDIDALPTPKSKNASKQGGAETGFVDRFIKITIGLAASLK